MPERKMHFGAGKIQKSVFDITGRVICPLFGNPEQIG
jgi:hypothetical protein